MIFGWQGFQLEHPDDWSPITLSGSRNEGYARIASPSKNSLQVRWKRVISPGDLKGRLRTYFQRLEQDARRNKATFRCDSEISEGRVNYRWTGSGHARGILFFNEPCKRLFFLEAVSMGKGSVVQPFRSLIGSFSSEDAENELWALFGLSLSIPVGLRLERQTLVAGRTQLRFGARGSQLIAERWGFGEQLLKRHGLESWARSALAMPKATANTCENGLQLIDPTRPLLPNRQAIVRYQQDRNQIVVIQTTTRSTKWRPSWDWLA